MFIAAHRSRPFFAECDRRNLCSRGALDQQQAAYRLRTTLTEPDIVFTRAAFIGMALEADAKTRVFRELQRLRDELDRAL